MASMAVILRYLTEIGTFGGQLRHSGCLILSVCDKTV